MTDEDAEKAFTAWDEGYGFMTGNLGRVAFMAGRESQRSRIAVLEAVIAQAKDLASELFGPAGEDFPTDRWGEAARAIGAPLHALLDMAPSTVLDQMIREAKAEAWDEGAAANWDGQDLRHPNPYRSV